MLGKTGHSATDMEKDLMKRIARKLTKDAGASMELCAPDNVDVTPLQPNENRTVNDGQGLRDVLIVTPSG